MGYTILTANLTPTGLSVTMADPSQLGPLLNGSYIQIEEEFVKVSGFSGKTVNLSARPFTFSTAKYHPAGALVQNTPPAFSPTAANITWPGWIVSRKRGEQWDTCERCGITYPMGDLVKQKGILVCSRYCFDNLTVERRNSEIERVLMAAVDQEGVDMRVYDRGFFEGFDIDNAAQ